MDWLQLPQTALEALLQRLDPATLGRALCCCREWRRLGSHRALWEPHLLRLFPGHPADDPGQGALPVHVQFARLAADGELTLASGWGCVGCVGLLLPLKGAACARQETSSCGARPAFLCQPAAFHVHT